MMSKNPPLVDADALLSELGESMPQGQPSATAAPDDLSDLDELLDESMETVRAKAQYEADLKARKRNFVGMSREEVEFCNSRMAAFELARIWELQYTISVWAIYECQKCGRERMVFSRLMEHQVSRNNAKTTRWVMVEKTDPEAEQYAVKEIRQVPTCPRCSEYELDPRMMTDLKEVLG
jgi:DNA-directed RNA polymerase subunit M/transcription elongation factor TFIIS